MLASSVLAGDKTAGALGIPGTDDNLISDTGKPLNRRIVVILFITDGYARL